MQNVFHEDLQKGTIDKSKYSKCLYVRINNEPKIKELENDGYEVVKQDDSADLILYGLPIPQKIEKEKDNPKFQQEIKNVKKK